MARSADPTQAAGVGSLRRGQEQRGSGEKGRANLPWMSSLQTDRTVGPRPGGCLLSSSPGLERQGAGGWQWGSGDLSDAPSVAGSSQWSWETRVHKTQGRSREDSHTLDHRSPWKQKHSIHATQAGIKQAQEGIAGRVRETRPGILETAECTPLA